MKKTGVCPNMLVLALKSQVLCFSMVFLKLGHFLDPMIISGAGEGNTPHRGHTMWGKVLAQRESNVDRETSVMPFCIN